jgi:hypothetical protein
MAADVAWNEQDTELDSTTLVVDAGRASRNGRPALVAHLRLAAPGRSRIQPRDRRRPTADHTDADARLLLNGGWKDWRTTFDAAFLRVRSARKRPRGQTPCPGSTEPGCGWPQTSITPTPRCWCNGGWKWAAPSRGLPP